MKFDAPHSMVWFTAHLGILLVYLNYSAIMENPFVQKMATKSQEFGVREHCWTMRRQKKWIDNNWKWPNGFFFHGGCSCAFVSFGWTHRADSFILCHWDFSSRNVETQQQHVWWHYFNCTRAVAVCDFGLSQLQCGFVVLTVCVCQLFDFKCGNIGLFGLQKEWREGNRNLLNEKFEHDAMPD